METQLWMPGYGVLETIPHAALLETVPHLKWLSAREQANGKELFVRLSAFVDDIRIDTDRLRCVPFTFTTTYREAMFCRSHKYSVDACDRFALPNNLPPRWMFVLKPKRGDVLRRGTVMPAFMKNGGGTEVFFENGTADCTLIDIIRW